MQAVPAGLVDHAGATSLTGSVRGSTCPLVITGDAPGLDQVIGELEAVIGMSIARSGDFAHDVYVGDTGRSDWQGVTFWDGDPSDHSKRTTARTVIAPRKAGSLRLLRHEIAHAWGLAHAPSGVMSARGDKTSDDATWNADERAWLHSFAARSCM